MPVATSTPKPLLINGEWVADATETFESINPANGALNYQLSLAQAGHVDAAVTAAKAAAARPAWRGSVG